MLPPDDLEGEPHDVPRGACPECASGDVTHLVIGMPAGPGAMEDDPDWVRWVGCVHPGFDRECGSCGATWSNRPVSAYGEFARAADGAARRGRCARRNR